MMNVDDALRITIDEVVGQNLHVAGQHHEIGPVLGDERVNRVFSLLFVVFGDRDDRVGSLVKIGQALVVGMIGNDQRDVASQFAALLAVKKIDQAMVVLRDENDHSRPL